MIKNNNQNTGIQYNSFTILDDLVKNKAIKSLSIGDTKISGGDIAKLWEETQINNLRS